MARLEPIWIFHSDPVVETIETVFPCSRILYLCFESLGLDITSVILNPLKMAATYLFLWFLSVKESYKPNDWFPRDTLLIERFLSIPTNFPFGFETCSNWILSISISKIYLRSCSNLLIGTNPRSLPREMNQYFLLELHHVLFIYITTQQKMGVLVNRTNDVEPRAPSFLYKIKNGGCKNPQPIMSFKSHVAFYHIVSNEVLP